MAQLFSNNASTTLSTAVTSSDTLLQFADPTVFNSVSGGDFELVTLTDGANWEVVKITANDTGGTVVVRGHEGTERAWSAGTIVSARVTAGTLTALAAGGLSNEATGSADLGLVGVTDVSGTNAIGIGASVTSTGDTSVVIGRSSNSDSAYAVAIGRAAECYSIRSVAISGFVYIDTGSQESVAIGYQAYIDVNSPQSIAIGDASFIDNDSPHGIAIGKSATVGQTLTDAIALGTDANAGASYSIAMGPSADANLAGTCHIAATPIVAKHVAAMDTGAELFRYYSAPQIVLATQEIDLTAVDTAPVQTITIPTGAHFYPDEIQVVIESSNTVTGDPDIFVGTTPAGEELLAATTITATSQWQRTINTAASRHGITGDIYVSVSAGTATALTGRVLITGILVEDS